MLLQQVAAAYMVCKTGYSGVRKQIMHLPGSMGALQGDEAAESGAFMLLMQDGCRLNDLQGGVQRRQQAVSNIQTPRTSCSRGRAAMGSSGASELLAGSSFTPA